MSNITRETTIEEILEEYPDTVETFMDFGIPCLVCGEPLWGTVEEAAEKYEVDLDELLRELNNITS
jgi:hybrid cluster-associated redox disulfide protein